MSKSKCPNVNSPEYKALAAKVGMSKAHTIYDLNNGNPVSLNADGTPSLIYDTIKKHHGETKAIEARANMFTELFRRNAGDIKVKNGVDSVYESNPELANIGTQELYSQYLDTIFPDSKVKDIIYRGKTDSQTNIKSKELGIFFTDDKNAANIYAVKYKGDEFDDSIIQAIVNKFGLNPTVEQIKTEIAFFKKMEATNEDIDRYANKYKDYILNNKGKIEQAIVNIKEPNNLTVKDWFDNYEDSSKLKDNSDGLILKGGKQSNNRVYDAGENQIVVFESEQIHILGSKQDIEGFKKYVDKNKMYDAFKELTVSPNGAVILPDGQAINILGKGIKSKAMAKHSMRLDSLEVGENMDSVIKTLEKALPNISINRESFDSTRNTRHYNDRAWVDSNGIHLNMQSMSYDTPIHELSHIWMKSLKEYDSTRYNFLLEAARKSIEDNKSLYERIKSKYNNKNEDELLEEYAATIAGFTSEKQVRKFMYRNNKYITEKESKSIYSRLSDIVNTIWESIKVMFKTLTTQNGMRSALSDLDFSTSTLNDMFQALTEDVLAGRGIIGFDSSSLERLMEKYYTNDNYDASQILFDEYTPITKPSEIIPYLMNRKDVLTGYDEMQKDIDAQHIVTSQLHTGTDGNLYYYDLGKRFVYDSTMSEADLIKRVREEIINPRYAYMNSFSEKMIEAIQKYKTHGKKKDINSIVLEVFGNKLGESQLNSILEALTMVGYNQPIEEIIPYKQLKTHATLSHLYNPALDGLNYLVILHTSKSSELDISLIDFANGKMDWSDNQLPSDATNLGYTFGYDRSKFSYSNKKSDIRKMLVAFTLAGLNKSAQQNNQRIRVRKAGVIGNNNLNVNSFMISNFTEAFENARTLFSLPQVHEQMDQSTDGYNYIVNLISDDNAFNASNIAQSYVNMLESYYMENKRELGLSSKFIDDILRDTNLLKARQLDLEKKFDYMNNPEHKLISMLIQYMEFHIDINGSQMNDISRKFKNITNPHNVKHDAVQMFSITAENVKSKIIDRLNDFKDEFQALAQKSIESHGRSLSLTINKPEDIFGHLFKKGKVKLKNDYKGHKAGETIEITMYNQIYGSYDLQEAKAAGLTDADIALADYILNNVKKQYVANVKHTMKMSNRGIEKSDAQLEQEVSNMLQGGRIPVMPMTRFELLRKGKFKTAAQRNYAKNAKGEYMVGENTERYDDVNYAYQSQLSDINQQYIQMGLMPVSGLYNTFEEVDMNRVDNQTMNLEYTMNMFIHDGVRKELLDTELIPAYHRIKQWLNTIKFEYGRGGKGQEVVEQYLDDYYNRVVLRQNRDENDKIDPFLRNAQNMFSFIALGYRPTVWMRSAYYNMQSMMLEGMAKSVTSMISVDEAKTLNVPGAGDMAKANAVLLTDFAKIQRLGKKFSIINSSEMDAIESIFTTMTDKNAFRSQVAQLGNYYSDMLARLVAMTAFMIKDGSYDAHTYNKETGELFYDVTKDKRFYENGDWKSDEAKTIFNDLHRSLMNDGLIKNDKMMVGYDFRDANTRFKWYADKFIIGSMDEYQKALMGQTAIGALAMQFRNYLPDKLFNLFGSNRLTSYGAVREVRMNADNEVEVIRKQIEIEGSVASWWYYLGDVFKVVRTKDKTLKELHEELSPIRRQNMAKTAMRAVFLTSILLGLYMLVKAGLSDEDRKKLEFLYSELLSWRAITDLNEGAILPLSKLISDIWSIMTGQTNWTRALRYTGPWYDGMWYMELLTDYDDLLLTSREQKHVSDMNEKELQEYREKMRNRQEILERNRATREFLGDEE